MIHKITFFHYISSFFHFLWSNRDVFYILFITISGIIYSGFYIASGYSSDDVIYLPALFQRIDPSLYQNDYIWLAPIKTFSFYIDLQLLLLKVFGGNLSYTLFFLYSISKFMLFLGIYHLSLSIFKQRLAAFAAILVLFLPISLPRTIATQELYLAPRMLAIGPSLFFLKYLIQIKYLRALICYAWIAMVYPIFCFLLGIISVGYFVLHRKLVTKRLITYAIITIAFVAIMYTIKWLSQKNLYPPPSLVLTEEWKQFYVYKAHYLFMKYWKQTDWQRFGLLTMPLTLFFLITHTSHFIKRKITRDLASFCAGILLCFSFSFLFINTWPLPLIIRMEPIRAFVFIVYIGFIGFSGIVSLVALNRKSALGLSASLLLLFSLAKMHISGFIFWFVIWILSVIFPFRAGFKQNLILAIFIPIIWLWLPDLLHQPNWYGLTLVPIFFWYGVNHLFPKFKKLYFRELSVVFTIPAILLYILVNHIQSNFPSTLYYGGSHPSKIYWREYLQQRVYFPSIPRTDWLSAQLWARDNTPSSAIFLVPGITQPGDLAGFRVFSHRAVAFEMKDGSLGSESEKIALEWLKRYKDLDGNELFSDEKLLDLSKKYQFTYILRSKANPSLSFPVMYENTWFRIYAVPQNS